MQATTEITTGLIIETRFLGPTDYRGSRVTAVCKRDSDRAYRSVVDWRHELNPTDNHRAAAEALIERLEAELTYPDAEPFQIVGRDFGGSSNASYYWLINRGGC